MKRTKKVIKKIIISIVIVAVLLATVLVFFSHTESYDDKSVAIHHINTAGLVSSIYYVINYDTVASMKKTTVIYKDIDNPYIIVHKNFLYIGSVKLIKASDTYTLVLPYSYMVG